MPREGTLRYENGWWRPARESLVAWRPSGWPRGRDVVWCREPFLALGPGSRGWAPGARWAPWMGAHGPGAVEHGTETLASRDPASHARGRGVMDVGLTHGAGLAGHQQTVMACRVPPDPLGPQADGRMAGR